MKVKKILHRRGTRGFTLLELLIAMSLLGLIFAALTGGLRFGTQAWQSSAERLANSDDLRLVYRTLRRQISTSLNAPGDLISAQQKGSFEGLRDSLSFVGPAPAQAMAPGLFYLKLILVPDEIGQALALRWERLENAAIKVDEDNIEPLLRGLRSIQFSYFGASGDDDTARWVNEWRDSERLPNLVRITVEFVNANRTPWPEIIIPITAEG
jgi:general secretion pathway protein J